MVERVLVYRPGALGDTVIALPCFHLIRRAFPSARIAVMTDMSESLSSIAGAQAVLGNSGLVDEFMSYPSSLRSLRGLAGLEQQIVRWRADLLVYMPLPPTLGKICRDRVFFRWCGLTKVVGIPWSRTLRHHRLVSEGVFESEASRLARCLATLGSLDLADPANWQLHQTVDEHQSAEAAVRGWAGRLRYIALSLGAALPAKHWGITNWQIALKLISHNRPDLGLLLLGAQRDRESSDAVMRDWVGPRLNLCGSVAPRVSALLLRKALIYLGHDSGPMHLAASVGTPCICVFSRRSLPGLWFPAGETNTPLYPWSKHGNRTGSDGIDEITPGQVVAAAINTLASRQMLTPNSIGIAST